MGEAADPGAGAPREMFSSDFTSGAASGSSIAALGLSAFSSVLRGRGTQAADEFQAAKAERAAQFGRVQASLTDTTFRERLNATLGNIDVIRAAAHIDPTSPTTAAIEAREAMVSDRQRTAAVVSQRMQADEDEASADYLRRAGDYALGMGYLDAGIKVGSGVAKMFTGGIG
jgi:hypothetical protein